MAVAELRPGPGWSPDGGGLNPARGGRTLETMVSNVHARYLEAMRLGTIFSARNATSVAPGTTATTAPPFALHNPVGSGKILVPLYIFTNVVSGTLGLGHMVLGYALQPSPPTGGTAIVESCSLLSANRGVGRAYTGSTVVAYTSHASIQTLAAAAPWVTPNPFPCEGVFGIPAGTVMTLESLAAAGTSPLVAIGCIWEEVQAA